MQPYEQKDWCYNDAVWDAQIHPDMYELYMKNFRKHVEPTVNCRIFMAFSYMGERRSRYGSWGHLESLAQVGGVNGNYMTIAPKYQALLDANAPKTSTRFGRPTSEISSKEDVITIYPNPAKEEIRIAGLAETSTVEIYGFDGRLYIKKDVSYDGAVSIIDLPIGVYVVKVTNSQQGTEIHKIIKE